ncbi:MAG: trehalose-6-phosphate synthase [Bacteroidia bacterium]
MLIISNRLPFKMERRGDIFELREADGGLASAMRSLTGRGDLAAIDKIVWMGSANFNKRDWLAQAGIFTNDKLEINPVFLDKKTEKGFYHGFSNSVIWPLFHYFPSFVEFSEKHYFRYEAANRVFADAISRVAQEDDIIWIHDYHLMLLPGYLRAMGLKNKIGFFLHIPFPSYELFRLLPETWRQNILQNLLAADIVGFQTHDYADHFKECVQKCLNTFDLPDNDWEEKVRQYPISIDFEKFNNAYSAKTIAHTRKNLRSASNNRKIIFSVDRLDYTKGVMNRLEAFEELLHENPGYIEKINFILNVVPSRDEIGKYKERKKMIEENISRINGRFGNINWQPVIYQYRHLSFNQLLSFYTSCNVALVTPLRDGMNLVAKEFVASRADELGVLVLSDVAGAARTLRDAITVTPTDIRKMKECIIQALEMTEQEQTSRMRSMRSEIKRNNINKWAESYLTDLQYHNKSEVSYDSKALVV